MQCSLYGATTHSLTTLSIAIFNITTVSIAIKIMTLLKLLSWLWPYLKTLD
jgi:hypothetical protein